jgi:hypothetical protein
MGQELAGYFYLIEIPTLIYIRTVLRMPAPLLVTLTAALAVVFQTLAATWSDIHKMFRVSRLGTTGSSLPEARMHHGFIKLR